MKNLKIEIAKKRDINQISELLQELHEPFTKNKDILRVMRMEDSPKGLLKRMKYSSFLIAKEGPKIVGVLIFTTDAEACLIHDLVIAKSERGRKIGALVLEELEKIARKNKCNKIYCYSAKSYRAGKFYKKNGFKQEGHLKKHWYGEDMYIFGKIIS